MRRRDFLYGTAAMAGMAPLAGAAIDVAAIKSRGTKKVDLVYKSPHSKPNGLQATREGLWVVDQGKENWVSLINFADGKVIREFQVPGLAGASGLTVDADGVMWINDTHNSLIVTCSAKDGKILGKYWCPGSGRPYQMPGDPAAARSPIASPFPAPPAAAGAGGGRGRGRGGAPGQVPLDATTGLTGEGGQGMEVRDGLLYYACLPSRRAYVLDPKTWRVQAMWNLPGNRAHGVGWEGDSLWISDSNWRAFFRHDRKTGEIVEKIQLTDKDPLIHGVTVHDGYMWFSDDVGYICNFKL
jgi:streptogramin lyase